MKSLNNFQNALSSDFKLCAHLRTGILYFMESKHNSKTYAKISSILFFRKKKSHFWHNCGAIMTITQPTKKFVKEIHSWIYSDINSGWIFSELKMTKILPFLTARYTTLCTGWLQPSRDDWAVRVQWFFSVIWYANLSSWWDGSFVYLQHMFRMRYVDEFLSLLIRSQLVWIFTV